MSPRSSSDEHCRRAGECPNDDTFDREPIDGYVWLRHAADSVFADAGKAAAATRLEHRTRNQDADIAGRECGVTKGGKVWRQLANDFANESDENSATLANTGRHATAQRVASSLLDNHATSSDNTGRTARLTLSRWRYGFESRTGCSQDPGQRHSPGVPPLVAAPKCQWPANRRRRDATGDRSSMRSWRPPRESLAELSCPFGQGSFVAMGGQPQGRATRYMLSIGTDKDVIGALSPEERSAGLAEYGWSSASSGGRHLDGPWDDLVAQPVAGGEQGGRVHVEGELSRSWWCPLWRATKFVKLSCVEDAAEQRVGAG